MENTEPLVSVIMPCYNDGAYLPEAVASLRAQTWQNLELIIIDDGSDDTETLKALKHVDFPNTRILHTDHVRPAAARNRGIREASGTYIFPLDADDTVSPEYIGEAVRVMEERKELGIVYCHADLFGEAEGKWDLPDYDLRMMLLDNCIFVTALFRKEDWETIGGFCEDFRAGMEDYDFWLSVLGLGREVYQFPETWFHYRIKKKSRTTQFNNSYGDVQETYVRLYERHRDFLAQHMDLYCKEMRYQLVDQLLLNRRLKEEVGKEAQESAARHEAEIDRMKLEIERIQSDPLLEYANSVRVLKPKMAARWERYLRLKKRIRRFLIRG